MEKLGLRLQHVLIRGPMSLSLGLPTLPSWELPLGREGGALTFASLTSRTQDPCEDSLGMGLEQASGLRAEAAAGASVPRTLSQKCTVSLSPPVLLWLRG